jgi:cbb3-type cytochrome oxidase subunit 1
LAGKKLGRFLDVLCVAGVFLVPVILGVFLFALISLEGAPVWYLVLHGIAFAASLLALAYYVPAGIHHLVGKPVPDLVRAVKLHDLWKIVFSPRVVIGLTTVLIGQVLSV